MSELTDTYESHSKGKTTTTKRPSVINWNELLGIKNKNIQTQNRLRRAYVLRTKLA